jgi:septum formation protein
VIECPVRIVLASASAARRELLGRIVPRFDVVVPRVDESRVRAEDPRRLVTALAAAKAREVASRCPGALVIAADTVAVCRGELVGKPADRPEALCMLRKLTRHEHQVLTGLCVVAPDDREALCCVRATVRMRALSRAELEELVRRPGALERAGAYALQPEDPNVVRLEGSETTVMGLPLEELERMVTELYPPDEGRDGSVSL